MYNAFQNMEIKLFLSINIPLAQDLDLVLLVLLYEIWAT